MAVLENIVKDAKELPTLPTIYSALSDAIKQSQIDGRGRHQDHFDPSGLCGQGPRDYEFSLFRVQKFLGPLGSDLPGSCRPGFRTA
jgi:hypothetical protein